MSVDADAVLVTGATGLLGASLVPSLWAAGWRVIAHGRSVAAEENADLTDRAESLALLRRVRPAAVVNLAAATQVDACERDPKHAWLLNAHLVEALGEGAGEVGARLIQISTDQVYEGAGPFREDDLTILNVYALSKRMGEMAAQAAGGTVLRTNFFGPSGVPGRPSASDWVAQKLREGRPFPAFDDVRFTPLHIATLCRAIARVLERPQAGVFNCGSRGGCTKADFAFKVAAALGLDPAPIVPQPHTVLSLPARRSTDMRMDSSAFERAFSFELPDTDTEIARLAHDGPPPTS